MADLKTIDLKSGKEGKAVSVDDGIFKAEFRPDLLNDYVIMQRRKARRGTHSCLTRAEVSGTGAKPFRQKGTGNARQGSLKGPHQEAGGVAFGPKPRSYETRLNKKTKENAIRSALSQKVFEEKLNVVEQFAVDSGKTRDAAQILRTLGTKSLLVVGEVSEMSRRALRNIPQTKALPVNALNVLDLLRHDRVVLTSEALGWINDNLKPAASRKERAA